HHGEDLFVRWSTNGFKGGTDTPSGQLRCVAEPSFTIEKLQKIEGSQGPFTANELEGKDGETVDYQIVVTNTGNTQLTFGPLVDPKCDEGTIEGGPGAEPVQPAGIGGSPPAGKTTYTCKHTITSEDGLDYTNVASVTGSPPAGQGAPVTNESNTVVVNIPEQPSFTIEKLQRLNGTAEFTEAELRGEIGEL